MQLAESMASSTEPAWLRVPPDNTRQRSDEKKPRNPKPRPSSPPPDANLNASPVVVVLDRSASGGEEPDQNPTSEVIDLSDDASIELMDKSSGPDASLVQISGDENANRPNRTSHSETSLNHGEDLQNRRVSESSLRAETSMQSAELQCSHGNLNLELEDSNEDLEAAEAAEEEEQKLLSDLQLNGSFDVEKSLSKSLNRTRASGLDESIMATEKKNKKRAAVIYDSDEEEGQLNGSFQVLGSSTPKMSSPGSSRRRSRSVGGNASMVCHRSLLQSVDEDEAQKVLRMNSETEETAGETLDTEEGSEEDGELVLEEQDGIETEDCEVGGVSESAAGEDNQTGFTRGELQLEQSSPDRFSPEDLKESSTKPELASGEQMDPCVPAATNLESHEDLVQRGKDCYSPWMPSNTADDSSGLNRTSHSETGLDCLQELDYSFEAEPSREGAELETSQGSTVLRVEESDDVHEEKPLSPVSTVWPLFQEEDAAVGREDSDANDEIKTLDSNSEGNQECGADSSQFHLDEAGRKEEKDKSEEELHVDSEEDEEGFMKDEGGEEESEWKTWEESEEDEPEEIKMDKSLEEYEALEKKDELEQELSDRKAEGEVQVVEAEVITKEEVQEKDPEEEKSREELSKEEESKETGMEEAEIQQWKPGERSVSLEKLFKEEENQQAELEDSEAELKESYVGLEKSKAGLEESDLGLEQGMQENKSREDEPLKDTFQEEESEDEKEVESAFITTSPNLQMKPVDNPAWKSEPNGLSNPPETHSGPKTPYCSPPKQHNSFNIAEVDPTGSETEELWLNMREKLMVLTLNASADAADITDQTPGHDANILLNIADDSRGLNRTSHSETGLDRLQELHFSFKEEPSREGAELETSQRGFKLQLDDSDDVQEEDEGDEQELEPELQNRDDDGRRSLLGLQALTFSSSNESMDEDQEEMLQINSPTEGSFQVLGYFTPEPDSSGISSHHLRNSTGGSWSMVAHRSILWSTTKSRDTQHLQDEDEDSKGEDSSGRNHQSEGTENGVDKSFLEEGKDEVYDDKIETNRDEDGELNSERGENNDVTDSTLNELPLDGGEEEFEEQDKDPKEEDKQKEVQVQGDAQNDKTHEDMREREEAQEDEIRDWRSEKAKKRLEVEAQQDNSEEDASQIEDTQEELDGKQVQEEVSKNKESEEMDEVEPIQDWESRKDAEEDKSGEEDRKEMMNSFKLILIGSSPNFQKVQLGENLELSPEESRPRPEPGRQPSGELQSLSTPESKGLLNTEKEAINQSGSGGEEPQQNPTDQDIQYGVSFQGDAADVGKLMEGSSGSGSKLLQRAADDNSDVFISASQSEMDVDLLSPPHRPPSKSSFTVETFSLSAEINLLQQIDHNHSQKDKETDREPAETAKKLGAPLTDRSSEEHQERNVDGSCQVVECPTLKLRHSGRSPSLKSGLFQNSLLQTIIPDPQEFQEESQVRKDDYDLVKNILPLTHKELLVEGSTQENEHAGAEKDDAVGFSQNMMFVLDEQKQEKDENQSDKHGKTSEWISERRQGEGSSHQEPQLHGSNREEDELKEEKKIQKMKRNDTQEEVSEQETPESKSGEEDKEEIQAETSQMKSDKEMQKEELPMEDLDKKEGEKIQEKEFENERNKEIQERVAEQGDTQERQLQMKEFKEHRTQDEEFEELEEQMIQEELNENDTKKKEETQQESKDLESTRDVDNNAADAKETNKDAEISEWSSERRHRKGSSNQELQLHGKNEEGEKLKDEKIQDELKGNHTQEEVSEQEETREVQIEVSKSGKEDKEQIQVDMGQREYDKKMQKEELTMKDFDEKEKENIQEKFEKETKEEIQDRVSEQEETHERQLKIKELKEHGTQDKEFYQPEEQMIQEELNEYDTKDETEEETQDCESGNDVEENAADEKDTRRRQRKGSSNQEREELKEEQKIQNELKGNLTQEISEQEETRQFQTQESKSRKQDKEETQVDMSQRESDKGMQKEELTMEDFDENEKIQEEKFEESKEEMQDGVSEQEPQERKLKMKELKEHGKQDKEFEEPEEQMIQVELNENDTKEEEETQEETQDWESSRDVDNNAANEKETDKDSEMSEWSSERREEGSRNQELHLHGKNKEELKEKEQTPDKLKGNHTQYEVSEQKTPEVQTRESKSGEGMQVDINQKESYKKETKEKESKIQKHWKDHMGEKGFVMETGEEEEEMQVEDTQELKSDKDMQEGKLKIEEFREHQIGEEQFDENMETNKEIQEKIKENEIIEEKPKNEESRELERETFEEITYMETEEGESKEQEEVQEEKVQGKETQEEQSDNNKKQDEELHMEDHQSRVLPFNDLKTLDLENEEKGHQEESEEDKCEERGMQGEGAQEESEKHRTQEQELQVEMSEEIQEVETKEEEKREEKVQENQAEAEELEEGTQEEVPEEEKSVEVEREEVDKEHEQTLGEEFNDELMEEEVEEKVDLQKDEVEMDKSEKTQEDVFKELQSEKESLEDEFKEEGRQEEESGNEKMEFQVEAMNHLQNNLHDSSLRADTPRVDSKFDSSNRIFVPQSEDADTEEDELKLLSQLQRNGSFDVEKSLAESQIFRSCNSSYLDNSFMITEKMRAAMNNEEQGDEELLLKSLFTKSLDVYAASTPNSGASVSSPHISKSRSGRKAWASSCCSRFQFIMEDADNQQVEDTGFNVNGSVSTLNSEAEESVAFLTCKKSQQNETTTESLKTEDADKERNAVYTSSEDVKLRAERKEMELDDRRTETSEAKEEDVICSVQDEETGKEETHEDSADRPELNGNPELAFGVQSGIYRSPVSGTRPRWPTS